MKELLVEKSKIKNNLKIINNIINKNGKHDNGEKVKLIAVVKGIRFSSIFKISC